MKRAIGLALAAMLLFPGGASALPDDAWCQFFLVSMGSVSSGSATDDFQAAIDALSEDEVAACVAIVGFMGESDLWPDSRSAAGSSGSPGDIPGTGIFLVGADIPPGTYRTSGPDGSSCYYARLSGLSGTLDDIISNDNAGGQAMVTIAATDVAFETSRCQPWTKVE